MARPETTPQDHLAKAREFIVIAESTDSKLEAYMKAADEIIAAENDDPTLSAGRVARRIHKSETWMRQLVKWRTNPQRVADLPFGKGNVKLDQ